MDLKIKKAFTYSDIAKRNFKTLDFQDAWLEHIGKPERTGSWIIWGGSGNGKTSYVLQLVRYLCSFERVHYNTLEEGMRESFKLALERNNIKSVASKFTFQSENYEQLVSRLSRKRMPKIVVIDSLQYFFRKKNASHYFDLLARFPDTIFIFISHARGSEPKGELADDIRYNSDVKIYVKDFVAEIKTSRFGGDKPFTIWEQGYNDRQLKLLNKG